MTEPKISPAAESQTVTVGSEQTPIHMVDSLLVDLDPIIHQACTSAVFRPEDRTKYPGVRAELPSDYARVVLSFIAPTLRDLYRVPSSLRPTLKAGYFSLVSRTAEQLSPLQCMPHFDSHEPYYIAVMHYLNPGDFGGTSFYRHRPTGYENITAARRAGFIQSAQHHLATHGGRPAQRYIDGSDDHFERLESLPYRQNRLLVYPGTLLHSGNIDPTRDISQDPRTGRLTANLFINFE